MIKQVFKKKHHTHKTKTIVRRKKKMGKCILRKKTCIKYTYNTQLYWKKRNKLSYYNIKY